VPLFVHEVVAGGLLMVEFPVYNIVKIILAGPSVLSSMLNDKKNRLKNFEIQRYSCCEAVPTGEHARETRPDRHMQLQNNPGTTTLPMLDSSLQNHKKADPYHYVA
jgi:hypothetical protein